MKIKDIVISSCNARSSKDENTENLMLLAESIKKHGLINRIILRKIDDDKYEVISGARRLEAIKLAYGVEYELSPDEYIVVDVTDNEAYLISVNENTKRLNFSPLDMNRIYLALNRMGMKDKEVANILGVSINRLKKIATISSDWNRIPEKAKEELSKTEAKFTEQHWDKLHKIEDDQLLEDVVNYVVENEVSYREVPTVVNVIKKNREMEEEKKEDNQKEEEKKPVNIVDTPIEYAHKGELRLEEIDGQSVLKVITKREEEIVPVDHYIEYLKNPSRFRCYVSFKLSIKPIEQP